jgi:hypothetical protein
MAPIQVAFPRALIPRPEGRFQPWEDAESYRTALQVAADLKLAKAQDYFDETYAWE